MPLQNFATLRTLAWLCQPVLPRETFININTESLQQGTNWLQSRTGRQPLALVFIDVLTADRSRRMKFDVLTATLRCAQIMTQSIVQPTTKSKTWSQSDTACFPHIKDKTEVRDAHKQAETKDSYSKGLTGNNKDGHWWSRWVLDSLWLYWIFTQLFETVIVQLLLYLWKSSRHYIAVIPKQLMQCFC